MLSSFFSLIVVPSFKNNKVFSTPTPIGFPLSKKWIFSKPDERGREPRTSSNAMIAFSTAFNAVVVSSSVLNIIAGSKVNCAGRGLIRSLSSVGIKVLSIAI